MIVQDLPITKYGINDAELDANPGLGKTMSAHPRAAVSTLVLSALANGMHKSISCTVAEHILRAPARLAGPVWARSRRRAFAIVESICIWTIKRA